MILFSGIRKTRTNPLPTVKSHFFPFRMNLLETKHKIDAIKKLGFSFFSFLVWVVSLVKVFKVRWNNNFLFWHYWLFCTKNGSPTPIWSWDDNFVLPWTMTNTRYGRQFCLDNFRTYSHRHCMVLLRLMVLSRQWQGIKYDTIIKFTIIDQTQSLLYQWQSTIQTTYMMTSVVYSTIVAYSPWSIYSM
jgi:hypothetical protein